MEHFYTERKTFEFGWQNKLASIVKLLEFLDLFTDEKLVARQHSKKCLMYDYWFHSCFECDFCDRKMSGEVIWEIIGQSSKTSLNFGKELRLGTLL
jgi:hypothetical protein